MTSRPMRPLLASALLALALCLPGPARALELTEVGELPLRLDITASTVAAWNGATRDRTVEFDQYGELINRINLQFGWWKLVGGLRLDTVTFANPRSPAQMARDRVAGEAALIGLESPEEIAEFEQQLEARYANGLRSRLRDDYRLGKVWLSYLSKHFEVTAGDSYVSFGRGLVLSLRKQDELAVDTTLRGGKIIARSELVTFTAVAGLANPLRLDEASGESLLPLELSDADRAAGRGARQLFGRDALFGARAELAWKKASFALHGVHLDRGDNLGQLDPIRAADGVQILGAGVGVPLWAYGSAYLEGAWQRYAGEPTAQGELRGEGHAVYSSLEGGTDRFTATVELQHYRDFDPLYASVDSVNAAFKTLAYSSPPNTESILADYRYDNFDRCVTGGRARLDGRISEELLVYGTYGRWATWGERGDCKVGQRASRNDVDAVGVGFELGFDESSSHLHGSAGLRHDANAEDGLLYYRELHGEFTLAKSLSGPWSVELVGRHRTRLHRGDNMASIDGEWTEQTWNEEDLSLGVRYAPSLVMAAGFEYTGRIGKPATYFNGSVMWKYTDASSVRLFAGQQRASTKCVSGTCREFPPFEGVKLEWVQRY